MKISTYREIAICLFAILYGRLIAVFAEAMRLNLVYVALVGVGIFIVCAIVGKWIMESCRGEE